jgi:uncharacterized protein YjiS (DUF1127 family)
MAHAPAFHANGTRSSIGESLLGVARQAWAAYWRRRAANAAAAMLRTLDDRTLKDLGLDRSEIDSVVHCGRAAYDQKAIAAARCAERRVGM